MQNSHETDTGRDVWLLGFYRSLTRPCLFRRLNAHLHFTLTYCRMGESSCKGRQTRKLNTKIKVRALRRTDVSQSVAEQVKGPREARNRHVANVRFPRELEIRLDGRSSFSCIELTTFV